MPRDSSAFCMATHSSPGGRPALEAQRKPRLSEAESGVLPILPPEKGRENRHLLRKGPGPHPALLLQLPSPGPAPGPSVVWGVWGLGTEEVLVWKEKWCEGRSRGHAIPGEWGEVRRDLGQGGGSEAGPETAWKAGKAVPNNLQLLVV